MKRSREAQVFVSKSELPLKGVKESRVYDSTAERDDLGIERENENERERSSVTSVRASVLGCTGREFKSIRAVSSCTQKRLRYWVVIRTKSLNGGKNSPLPLILKNRNLHKSSFLANWYLKISSPNVFGLPPTAPYLQQLSKVDVVVHYGNEVNSRADVYRVSCHASSVTAAVPSLVTKRLRCKLSNSPYFHNFLKEKKRTYDEQRKQQPQPRYQDSSIVTVFLVRKDWHNLRGSWCPLSVCVNEAASVVLLPSPFPCSGQMIKVNAPFKLHS